MNKSAKGLSIVTLSTHQTFPLYGMSYTEERSRDNYCIMQVNNGGVEHSQQIS